MAKDCSPYLQINKIAAALQRSDPSVQKEILLCLDAIYKQPFLKNILFPFLLAPPDEIVKTAEESFEQAVTALFELIRGVGKAKQPSGVEQPLLHLFKLTYHKQLSLLLKIPDATVQVSFTLLKMNMHYRDYFIWHYINNFTVGQISVITGKQSSDVKNDLWISREQ